MQVQLPLLAIVFLGSGLSAQNLHGIVPGATTVTSRSGIAGGEDGDILTQMSLHRGVGQVDEMGTTVGRVNGFRVVYQDQDASTQENRDHALGDADVRLV